MDKLLYQLWAYAWLRAEIAKMVKFTDLSHFSDDAHLYQGQFRLYRRLLRVYRRRALLTRIIRFRFGTLQLDPVNFEAYSERMKAELTERLVKKDRPVPGGNLIDQMRRDGYVDALKSLLNPATERTLRAVNPTQKASDVFTRGSLTSHEPDFKLWAKDFYDAWAPAGSPNRRYTARFGDKITRLASKAQPSSGVNAVDFSRYKAEFKFMVIHEILRVDRWNGVNSAHFVPQGRLFGDVQVGVRAATGSRSYRHADKQKISWLILLANSSSSKEAVPV